jgi:lipopolysaccharide export LptBFGC system permease protein LptF
MGLGNALGRGGTIPPFIGAWLPNFILTGYGLYIFAKVKN